VAPPPEASPPGSAAPELSPERWRRLDELFAAAVDLPAAERRAFVTWTCADDPDLRLRLEELIDADPDSEGFVARAVAAGLAADRETRGEGPAPDEGEPEGLPRVEGLRRVGPYRLLREIGRGGTGRVFVAERAEGGFGQRVAVKLLRPGMDSEEILKRFTTERSILARLEHPGIARLYDGGTTADGRPYFVMEAIDGRPIDQWASERRVDLAARLALFVEVCRAVHYAHQNLVVHRDLKPSNVLVTRSGQPKLLDFGIAKLLDPDLSHEATHTALRPMTPGYASPEQVRGDPVTTASDVYALGVLLYRLLTGRHPYRLEGSSAAELERRITDEEPLAPSSVAVRSQDRRRLAGDLDNVVARAMEKRPERRYASAEQLALDVERHLAGHPVAARSPTLAYRGSRFLSRHRLPVAVAAAFAVLLAAFVASTLVQSRRVAEERDRAERVSAVLVDLFEVADPGRGASVTAREILDQGAVRVREELTGTPELRATVLETIARAYRNLVLYESAEPLLEEAVALRRMDRRSGRGSAPDRAGAHLAAALDELGVVRALSGDYEGAEPLLAEALELRLATLGPAHPDTSRSFDHLALVRHDRGDYAGAEPLYRRALETGSDPPHPTTLANYALLLHDLDRLEEAEARFRQARELRRASAAEGVEDEVALAFASAVDGVYLASTVQALGRLEEAEDLARQALAGFEARRGPEHPDVARACHVLGSILVDRGALGGGGSGEGAEPYLRRALAIREQALGARHPETAATREELARLAAAQGESGEAERLYGEAVRDLEAALGPDHPETDRARRRLRALQE
jgi:eukaryotic-like serine/threonine-protein kinase